MQQLKMNSYGEKKNRKEEIQKLCICVKEIKIQGKLLSVVLEAGGKVDIKSQ